MSARSTTIATFLLLFCTRVFCQFSLDELIEKTFPQLSTTPKENTNPVAPAVTPAPADQCRCVEYYLCKNDTINIYGEGILDVRVGVNPCGIEYLKVCCKNENILERRPTAAPTVVAAPTGCGHRHPEGVGFRIVGDENDETQFGEFPWMGAVFRVRSVEGSPDKLMVYRCGGALIHPQAVLTAAHCVNAKNESFKVRVGEWDAKHTQEVLPHQDREVESIAIHPRFHSGSLFNDVAVLKLKTPVKMTDNIGLICLPRQDDIIQAGRCIATGWGKDSFGPNGKYQEILKKIDLPVVPNRQCQEKLRTTRLGRYFELNESFMCAGGEPKKDTCKGDGGSPLVCRKGGTDRYFQAGIVSWGIGCGENQIPGVYANVAKFRNFIDDQMKLFGLDTSVYEI